jgi:collagenase-like PrtC family protease
MVRETVERAHKMGMEINYLLNATCIGNLEFTKRGYKNIRRMLDWLSEIEVDTVTVALPFIAEVVKRHYPDLKISISTQADVDSLEKAKYWEALGADSITLSHVGMNRNFEEIKRITDNCNCKTQLITNMFCKRGCPYVSAHGNFYAHASHSWSKMNRFNIDYYFISCVARNFCDPLSIIKSSWIRPEDLCLYERLGIDRFKLVERGLKSDALAFIIEAYRNGSHTGSLMSLIPSTSKYVFMEKQNFVKTMKNLLRVSLVNVFKMRKVIGKLAEFNRTEKTDNDLDFYIDNKTLDGAIEFFMQKRCMQTTCGGCNFCDEMVEKAVVKIDNKQFYPEVFREVIDDLVEGKYF